MITKQPILSFLVVTYNHSHCIRRCIDSLLALPISIPYEIVIGDDRSSDDTYKILQEYQIAYPDKIKIYQVNSDTINPKTNGERAGYNRSCGYQLLSGKYYAEVDGDDYVLPNDIYQCQVEMLEKYPECGLCMQNILVLRNGANVEEGVKYHPNLPWDSNTIISAEEYLYRPEFFMQHQGFVYRRHKDIDPTKYTGRFYEDTTVSLFHLQYGNVGIIDESGYVWICHTNGINGTLTNDDRHVVLGLLPFLHIALFPKLKDILLRAEYVSMNGFVKQLLCRKYNLSNSTINYLLSIKLPIYQRLAIICEQGMSCSIRLRIYFARIALILARKCKYNKTLLALAYKVLNGNVNRLDIIQL